MKRVHTARHAPEAHLVRGYLEANGVEAIVRGDALTSGWGELPADVCSVWIVDDARVEQAQALLTDYLSGAPARKFSGERWTCVHCGEALEGQFTECWNCGAARP